ncbi:endo-1,3;1,4-beta-D-glucanase [Morus notabilis]|uniref:endo-1,3;1,4-beta-D-glucanase n=1 Tax=Morus notabilis TaxID=981085 RepID=UPI000CECFB87|nr:endo-1,3;1,4-beta-D-glucanase [Morus notabilis]
MHISLTTSVYISLTRERERERMAGNQCCSNPPVMDPGSGEGSVEELGGLKVYTSGSPSSKMAVILISDVFGYEAPNIRMVADKVAASGFFVVVPDFFHGDPFAYSNNKPLAVWLKDHGTDKGFEEVKPVVEALKSKGFSSLGAAGFCWGAKVVTEISKSKSIIQAAVLLHPSFVTLDDITGVNVPIAILGAEIDDYSPPALLKQFEAILIAKPEVDSHVEIFPNVKHGWTLRYNVNDEAAVNSAEEAHRKMLEWFSKYVN